MLFVARTAALSLRFGTPGLDGTGPWRPLLRGHAARRPFVGTVVGRARSKEGYRHRPLRVHLRSHDSVRPRPGPAREPIPALKLKPSMREIRTTRLAGRKNACFPLARQTRLQTRLLH